jgi:hypothetical protein
MDRTGPSNLIPRGFTRDEADELEDVRQRNHGSDCGKVNARHGWSRRTDSRETIRAGDMLAPAPMGTKRGTRIKARMA